MRNQIAETLSRLTAIGSIVVLMQVTTTSFGMNVQVPGEEVNNVAWWCGILGFELLVAVLLLFILRKARII
jgi:magnesium transporter